LSLEQALAIKDAALDVLASAGVRVMGVPGGVLQEFRNAGCTIHEERVYIPVDVTLSALASAPQNIVLYSRDKSRNLPLVPGLVYFGTGALVTEIIDLDSGRRRPSTLEDVSNFARLAQSIDDIDYLQIVCTPNDVPLAEAQIYKWRGSLPHTTKHIMGGVESPEQAHVLLEEASRLDTVGGSLLAEPFLSLVACVLSPLTLDPSTIACVDVFARHGLPVVSSVMALAGATSPCRLMGTLVQTLAESLSQLVYCQIVNPGTPVLLGCVSASMDMRYGTPVAGGPELALLSAYSAQMAQQLSIPYYGTGGTTSSFVPDLQAGAEKMLTGLLTALAGANLVHDMVGLLGNLSLASYEQVVIDSEIVAMIRRTVEGIQGNPQNEAQYISRLAVSADYLRDEETVRHCRTELWHPIIMARRSGEEDIVAKARGRVREILGF
jgi:trimethylamine--corrinoid protein Co-methyltransferase